MVRFKVDVMPA